MGDLKENGDYHAAKDEYGMFNDRKNLLLSILEDSELATPPKDGEVGVLSTVTILFDGDDEDDKKKNDSTELEGTTLTESTTEASTQVRTQVTEGRTMMDEWKRMIRENKIS